MRERCPTCGRFYYQKIGYNKKSLLNLTSFGHDKTHHYQKRTIRNKSKCVISGCNNKRLRNSILCVEHYLKRSIAV
jgi:hypothetical protein